MDPADKAAAVAFLEGAVRWTQQTYAGAIPLPEGGVHCTTCRNQLNGDGTPHATRDCPYELRGCKTCADKEQLFVKDAGPSAHTCFPSWEQQNATRDAAWRGAGMDAVPSPFALLATLDIFTVKGAEK